MSRALVDKHKQKVTKQQTKSQMNKKRNNRHKKYKYIAFKMVLNADQYHRMLYTCTFYLFFVCFCISQTQGSWL